ncbi:MAG TPA: TonB-dependent receptor [Candidatus Dormibacteraeota bacterium]|nr:TonB-dependent receptor [Candidatus Dormibacteraeota bacterium]
MSYHRAARAVAALSLMLAMIFLMHPPAFAATSGLVTGTVDDAQHHPVAGADVQLVAGQTHRSTTTDAQGRFSFPGVPFGRYRLYARKAGAGEAQLETTVFSGQLTRVAVTLELKVISHVVTYGRAVRGAPVSVNQLGSEQMSKLPVAKSLNSIIETLPGIVSFSYNEPVAHGFHGLTYNLDGAPLPSTTTQEFSEVIPPQYVGSMEVFTGAIPAEFGGQRSGAVVNLQTLPVNAFAPGFHGSITQGIGNFGQAQGGVTGRFREGNVGALFSLNSNRTNDGLDSPTFVPQHDSSSSTSQLASITWQRDARDKFTVNAVNSFDTFQVPINTVFSANDPVVQPPGTNDTQLENSRFYEATWTHYTKDLQGYLTVAPWFKYGRVRYNPDVPNDLASYIVNPDGTTTPFQATSQDIISSYAGLRVNVFHTAGKQTIGYGVEGDANNVVSNYAISQTGVPTFASNVRQRGTTFGAFVQDQIDISPVVTSRIGVRYDRSVGFVSGNQISPRIELNLQADRKNVLHYYYGRFYAAPALEDTRADAVFAGGSGNSSQLPVYDLKPEQDSYMEFGLHHAFGPGYSGYVDVWSRNVSNVLDTTQLANTPIYALYNSAIGRAQGIDMRLQRYVPGGDFWYLSSTISQSLAQGISGGTFLFSPADVAGASQLEPEDHDQTVSAQAAYEHVFGRERAYNASLQTIYGTGFPVQFLDGSGGRLLPHLTFNVSVGRDAGIGSPYAFGWNLSILNLTDYAYLLKVNNGFNTTQWGQGRQILFTLTEKI